MKTRSIKNKLLAMGAAAALLAGGSAAAGEGGWRLLPMNDAGFELKPTVSVIYGVFDPDSKQGDSAEAVGVEFAFNCILLQPPTNRVRQQLSYIQYDDGGLEVSSLELNPHYTIDLTPNWAVGFGPGLGYVMADSKAGADADMFALQVGAGAQYYRGAFFAGVEARYQVTEGKTLGVNDEGLDNFRALAKLGVNF